MRTALNVCTVSQVRDHTDGSLETEESEGLTLKFWAGEKILDMPCSNIKSSVVTHTQMLCGIRYRTMVNLVCSPNSIWSHGETYFWVCLWRFTQR